MKQVTTREFQLNLSKYLNELPILLTRYGKPIAIIQKASQLKAPEKVATKEEVATPEKKVKKKYVPFLGKYVEG